MSDYVGDNKWIPKGESSVDSERIIWSTKQINDLMVALDQGYSPNAIFFDEPIEIQIAGSNSYRPKNYTGEFIGPGGKPLYM